MQHPGGFEIRSDKMSNTPEAAPGRLQAGGNGNRLFSSGRGGNPVFWQRSWKDDAEDVEAALPDLPLSAFEGGSAQHRPPREGQQTQISFFFPPFFSFLFVFQAKLPRPEHAATAAMPRNQLCRNNIPTRSRGKG